MFQLKVNNNFNVPKYGNKTEVNNFLDSKYFEELNISL